MSLTNHHSHFKCVKSGDRLFTAGTAYEVHSWENGVPLVCTDEDRIMVRLPHHGSEFVPHDPWARYRAQQAEGRADA